MNSADERYVENTGADENPFAAECPALVDDEPDVWLDPDVWGDAIDAAASEFGPCPECGCLDTEEDEYSEWAEAICRKCGHRWEPDHDGEDIPF